MRHNKSGRKFNRSNSHRKAMFRNMARALLTYERIRTTEPKAKELRKVVDNLITLAIRNDLHSRRLAYKALNNHQLVQRLFDVIGPRFAQGGGGYTRILKLSQPRKGDCAPMVVIELTKKEEESKDSKESKKEANKEAKKETKKAAKEIQETPESKDEQPEKPVAKKTAQKEKAEGDAEEKPAIKKAAPKKKVAAKAKAENTEEKPKKKPAPKKEASTKKATASKTEDVK